VRAIVLGLVLLAATVAQAEDRKCIREMMKLTGEKVTAIRLCDPKNYVSNPNEYGWVCEDINQGPVRKKGEGAKQSRDALCE
jgi:hypothetical protein